MIMIAIKDMEMPSYCGKCSFCGRFNPDEDICGADGHIFTSTLATITKNRDSRCPLIPIEQSEDCVSRQVVLDLMQLKMGGSELYKAVYELPTVTPTHGTCKNCNRREDCFIDTDDDFYCRDWERREYQ